MSIINASTEDAVRLVLSQGQRIPDPEQVAVSASGPDRLVTVTVCRARRVGVMVSGNTALGLRSPCHGWR